ncbi:unnamed protein product, partial [Didymodactylos carnosus]
MLHNWRDESIQSINQMYEFKKQELDRLTQAGSGRFDLEKSAQLKDVDELKTEAGRLMTECSVTFIHFQTLKEKFFNLQEQCNELSR